ncbi:hypothetical protein C0992_007067 [Termitomyces sp. T32_za158]|nr:hypothetical protein C0992_007067 [Termitomyces sp. T32_za158]
MNLPPGATAPDDGTPLTHSETKKISIHLSYPQDDSYTPSTLAVRAGTGPSDLQDVRLVTLEKPDGWITFDVSSEPNEDADAFAPLYAYVIQIIIAQNHMSGKDTHVRGLKILGPVEYGILPFNGPTLLIYIKQGSGTRW